jgi:hypothetical protein
MPNMEEIVTIRGRSRGRGGQLVTYYHHFKNEIFNVAYDQIIVEFNNRFAERSTHLLRCIDCLDPRNSFANYNKEKIMELAQLYDDDFCHYDLMRLREQLGVWIADIYNQFLEKADQMEDSDDDEEVAAAEIMWGKEPVIVNQRWVKQTKGTYDFDVTKADKLFEFLVKEGRIKLPEGHSMLRPDGVKEKRYCGFQIEILTPSMTAGSSG